MSVCVFLSLFRKGDMVKWDENKKARRGEGARGNRQVEWVIDQWQGQVEGVIDRWNG